MKTVFSSCALNYTKPIGNLAVGETGVSGRPDFGRLSPELKEKLIRDGEYYLKNYTFQPIAPSLYMGYKRTGDRIHFEDVYFAKRMALGSLTLAECVEKKGRFLDAITDGVYSICEETGWWLPAHNSYSKRQTDEKTPDPATALPDPERPILDLFGCETGGILGMVYYLLGDELSQADPLVPARIRNAVQKRILKPFLTEYYWWMGDGSRAVNNWTTWCVLNVLISCLTLDEPQSVKRAVLRQAAESLDYFLDTYKDDGYCSEGAAYYTHAGLNLADDLDVLCGAAPGAFDSVRQLPLVKNILLYICRVYVANGWFINYSDCAAHLEGNGLREYAAGKAFDLPALQEYGLARFHQMRVLDKERGIFERKTPAILDEEDAYGTAERNLYLRVKMLFLFDEAEARTKAQDAAHTPGTDKLSGSKETAGSEDFVFDKAQLMIVRGQHLLLAAKGGSNDDSHNHNDVGSIIVYRDGAPMLIDAGVGDYTKKTFSPQRYEIWTMRSSYHNLPDIDGMEQAPGAQAYASDVKIDLASGTIRMNLRDAYPGLKDAFVREAAFDRKNERIVLRDVSSEPHTLIHHFMTWKEPKLLADGRGFSIGELGILRWDDERAVSIEKIPLTDRRLVRVWGESVCRVSVKAKACESTFTIET